MYGLPYKNQIFFQGVDIMQSKIKTTINIDEDIIKNIKIVALNREKTQTEIITEYLKQGLNNEQDTNKKIKSLNEIAGIFKGKQNFNSVEEVRKLRKG